MATTSEVKAGLDAIAQSIAGIKGQVEAAVTLLQGQETNLTELPAQYTDLIAEVNGYVPTGAFETLAKDELAKLTTEFQALKTQVTAALGELA